MAKVEFGGGVPDGIVYLRTDIKGSLAPYGGQAINDARFLARQTEHARAFPNSEFKFTIVDRAVPGSALDIAEYNFIQELTAEWLLGARLPCPI